MKTRGAVRGVLLALTAIAGCQGREQTVEATQSVVQTTCMQDIWAAHGNSQNLTCTANDVRIAKALSDSITDLSGNPLSQCISGQKFSFKATFEVDLTADARYDVGLYFATDGDTNHDGALTGGCTESVITSTNNTLNFINKDPSPDTCGDIDANHNPQYVTVTVTDVLCQDTDNDGKLNLPNCTSWRQPGSNDVCQGPNDAFPGSPSKCNCDIGFNVPIFVEPGSISVTKAASPASLPEPGGEFTFTVTTTNTATYTSVTLNKICDDKYGTVAGTGCTAGSLGTVNSTTCTVPQTLAPGGSYACTFKANFTAHDAASDTDTVTVSGVDQNGKALSNTGSATVSVTDVPPTATVTKGFNSLLCAKVRYNVSVANTSANDAVSLTALNDSVFGDLTTVHGSVNATTCNNLPATIAVGLTPYTCTFDATFCGSSNTDKITATLDDGESNTITPVSNQLTVYASAGTTAPTP